MMKRIFFLSLFIIYATIIYSQEQESEHKHPEAELGISGGLVYNLTEEEFAPGIHVHIVKTVSNNDKIGLGFGYEAIFDDHRHNAVSFIILYRPLEHLSFNFSPGISWLANQDNSEKASMHIEGLYEWELGNFHLGPLLGVAFNSEDFHASVGLHLAIGF